ncbi:MAG: hypothetical protein HETSPECPRED_004208 [Heterodermia speciosa]|uniref:RING-type E3 ubiquitin transferase n=1 Tax=Heterodermia speciosa TaxID=116794 RepID=A0A8H3F7T9_9LECA|nr:MAG: hypothetical protein HETSPECPRED_004208 [Heterodermia speciosa]
MEEALSIKQPLLKSTSEEVQNGTSIQQDSDPCVICLETISERAVTSPCGHENFDFLCLVSWLQERSSCPLCKRNVYSVAYCHQARGEYEVYKVHQTRTTLPDGTITRAPHNDQTRGRTQPRYPNWRSQRSSQQRQPISADAALLRRKEVYRQNLYSSHVGTNRLSKYKDLTPRAIASDEKLISRARKWIRRELKVFEFLNSDEREECGASRRANNAEFLMEYIVAILKTVDTKGASGQAEDMLQEFLGRDTTRLFLHELRAWLRSPYDSLENWDRHVQYGRAMEVDFEDAKPRDGYNSAPQMPRTGRYRVHDHKNGSRRSRADEYSPNYNHGSQNRNSRSCG